MIVLSARCHEHLERVADLDETAAARLGWRRLKRSRVAAIWMRLLGEFVEARADDSSTSAHLQPKRPMRSLLPRHARSSRAQPTTRQHS